MSFHQLVSHNPDLQRLRDEGYAVSNLGGYLIVRDIPYLDSAGELQSGVLAAAMKMSTPLQIEPPEDHQVLFAGERPCHLNGQPIQRLGGGPQATAISPELTANHSFSNKPHNGPPRGYENFYDKIVAYCRIICGPAEAKFEVTPRNFTEYKNDDANSPFNFVDTMSSRAKIVELSALFEGQVVGIIGLGGTGSYVLDALAKVPVSSIHLYDGDKFYLHNAYRSPGGFDEVDFGRMKADLFAERYSAFRKRIFAHPWYVTTDRHDDLAQCHFVFLCVDKGLARKEIVDLLQRMEIPFVDVGMGLRKSDGRLQGLVRTVHATPDSIERLKDAKVFPEREASENIYQTDVQICELNALNACLAVISYKRSLRFYDERLVHNYSLFNISSNKNATEAI